LPCHSPKTPAEAILLASGGLAVCTVVIASYRYGHLAAQAIESVLAQTRPAERILFVDDEAGDCSRLPALYPEVDFVLRDRNLGVVENFQDMLSRVRSDRCLFLGADNWLRSDALELLEACDADIVTYDIVVTGTERETVTGLYPCRPYQGDAYWDRRGLWHGSMLYRVSVARMVGGYARSGNPRYTGEDKVLWNRMRAAGATVLHVPEGLLYYRRHRQNFFKYEKGPFRRALFRALAPLRPGLAPRP
jgi:glycosyltransferase involved in cell wall biosynthesis